MTVRGAAGEHCLDPRHVRRQPVAKSSQAIRHEVAGLGQEQAPCAVVQLAVSGGLVVLEGHPVQRVQARAIPPVGVEAGHPDNGNKRLLPCAARYAIALVCICQPLQQQHGAPGGRVDAAVVAARRGQVAAARNLAVEADLAAALSQAVGEHLQVAVG